MESGDFSCLKEVTKVVHLTLPSSFNSNELSGICDALESWKRQYIQQLQGIVVSFKNVSLTSKRGYLKIDYPVIHCNIQATFELFYPTVGSIVKGKVNRISHDHIGCLVHDTINVTLHRTSDISEEDLKCIALDRYILFQITRIYFKRKIINVKGKITEKCINLMKESGLFDQEAVVSENNSVTCPSPQFSFIGREIINHNPVCNSVQNSVDETSSNVSSQFSSPSKKKKHKKNKNDVLTSPSVFSESFDSGINEIEPTQIPVTPSKKKHKSKTNILIEGIRNVSSTDSMLDIKDEVHTTESDISTSPTKSHKKKKRKKSDYIPDLSLPSNDINSEIFSLGLTNSLSESDISSSTKKKKKKRKKSTEDTFESPSSVSEPAKKKPKKSASDYMSDEDESESLLKPNITHLSPSTIYSPALKVKKESPGDENKIEDLPSLLASLKDDDDDDNHKDTKKAKKRKHESTDDGNLPQKKRKITDSKGKVKEKSKKKKKDKPKKGKKKKDKSEKDKKKKDKSEKDSKKDKKKKLKNKVISTKKKAFGSNIKPKKKSKDKKEKSKGKKKDKPIKEEPLNVP